MADRFVSGLDRCIAEHERSGHATRQNLFAIIQGSSPDSARCPALALLTELVRWTRSRAERALPRFDAHSRAPGQDTRLRSRRPEWRRGKVCLLESVRWRPNDLPDIVLLTLRSQSQAMRGQASREQASILHGRRIRGRLVLILLSGDTVLIDLSQTCWCALRLESTWPTVSIRLEQRYAHPCCCRRVLKSDWQRFGVALTHDGPMNLRQRQFANDHSVIDPECPCPTCDKGEGLTRSYIHTLTGRETVGAHAITLHNLCYQARLLSTQLSCYITETRPRE